MNDYISTKMQTYLNENVHKYMTQSRISLDGTWSIDAEVMATTSLIGYDIIVYSKFGQTLEWLKFPTNFTFSKTTDYALCIETLINILMLY